MTNKNNKEDSNPENKSYWINKMSGNLTLIDFPGVKFYAKEKANTADALRAFFSKEETKELHRYIVNEDGSLFMLLLASLNILFYKYTSQTDIVLSTQISGVKDVSLQNQIDFNGSTVLFRQELRPLENFNSFYHKVKETLLQDYKHQPYPFDQLVTDLNALTENENNANFNYLVSFNAPENKSDFETTYNDSNFIKDLGTKISKLDMEIAFQEYDDILFFDIIYNTDLYENDTVERLIIHFKTLLFGLISEPNVAVENIDYLSNKEQDLLLNIFNKPEIEVEYPKDKTIVDLFFDQVEKAPNSIAVVFNDKKLSYKELDILSNQLANYLISKHKIVVGDLVAVMLERSEWMIVSLLGILKSGAAYVPIDPEYPIQRKNYIQSNCECKLTIDDSFIDNFNSDIKKNTINTPPAINLNSNNLAYVIYTSGTTGNPKGVPIKHKAVVNLISYQTKLFKIDQEEKIVQFSSFCFDASVEQIFLSLSNGCTLFMISKEIIKNHLLLSFIEKNGITHLHATPSFLETLQEFSPSNKLKRIIAGGEICPVKLAKKLAKFCDFYNKYGPTENTVTSSIHKYIAEDDQKNTLPIGKPVGNNRVYILSQSLKLQGIGVIGELCVSGLGVSQGYINLPELNSEKFIQDPFNVNSKMYLTGDYAKWLPTGEIEFVGRKDDQVKIRGYRIELGEIEAALLSLNDISRAYILALPNSDGESRLIAYLQSKTSLQDSSTIKQQLQEILPDYLIPSLFVWVEDFPMTSNGKIDKKNLPSPEYIRPNSAPLLRNPRTKIEKEITKIWKEQLQISVIGIDDNFFELGGTSLLTQRVVTLLRKQLNLNIVVTNIYQYPTIATLSEFLEKDNKTISVPCFSKQNRKDSSEDVAIIGMSGRFPGAKTINELWDVLKEGKETISFFKPEELDASISESLRNDPLYVKARGIIPSANTFDAAFFGINPKLAECMDPQQRIFLEIAWEALEQTGYLPKHYKGSIGVYAGTRANSYYKKNILPNKELLDQVGYLQAETVNEKDYISSRTAYHLNLKGPAVSVHSACSTSLLAIAQAVEAIRNGQCDIALAGGSSISAPINSGHLYQEGSMLSQDGHCRSFDASSNGTVFSDGAGVILLKSLDAAQRDGDKIYGLIKGVGINNDGGNKGSFTAPSADGQAGAILKALNDAQISPDTISYVEAHGTATPLGDPIEIEGLKMAFGNQNINGYCAIGSIKSNMGHLTSAAGVAGLIKTILSMNNKLIPPSLGYEKPNPAIDFENSPFFVNSKLRHWDVDGPRRAGVSSFGLGGTNVHLVLEEYPIEEHNSSASRPLQLLMWSAKSENSVKGYQKDLGNFLRSKPDLSLADVAFSLNKTRDTFIHRRFLLSSNIIDASTELLSAESSTTKNAVLKIAPSELAFLFPGQGSQFSQMGLNLYKNEPVYKEAIDKCAEFLLDELKLDIREILYPEVVTSEAEAKLKNTRYTQPALFVTEYALSQLWLSWGIKPTVFCGHSIGEFVAAHLAGIFNLKDALHLIAVRGRLVSELPSGSMLSVRLSEDNLKKILPESISIAAINSNILCVVAGKNEKVEEFSKSLDLKEIANKLLFTSHAFHSNMMDPILGVFEAEVKKVQLNKPILPIVSTVTGTWLQDDEALNPKYWTNHLRNTVRFADAADTILKLDDTIFLEVGPGQTLTTLTKQQGVGKIIPAFSSLSLPKNQENEYNTLLTTLGELWLRGFEPDWDAFYGNQKRHKVDLPSYAFDRKPCWVNAPNLPTQNSNPNLSTIQNSINNHNKNNTMRKTTILSKISAIVSQTSGIDYPNDASSQSFLDLGLDSLTLTQLAISIKKDFKLPITFRQLNEEYDSPSLLADYLDLNLPKEEYNDNNTLQSGFNSNGMEINPNLNPNPQNNYQYNPQYNHQNYYQNTPQNNSALGLIAQQIQLLGKQMELLQGNMNIVPNNFTPESIQPQVSNIIPKNRQEEVRTKEEVEEHKKPFGAAPRIERQVNEMSFSQKEFLQELISRYTKKTAASKDFTKKHRDSMADPRVVTGFKPLTKEVVYPIVIEKSKGNRLWDLDGNEYMDVLNGFGSCFFGHQPDFVTEALHKQIDLGYEVGPQHPLAGDVCQLLCEITNHDRAALCNTGSEAVLGAMRIARTVTGRSLIVAFTGSYHGIMDEVIVRGSKKLLTFPAAPGILPEAVQNMLILEYGTEESLRIIRERADELAAVLVEPVQSRRPEFQPIEFLKELREVTSNSGITLIFDEVISGFRMHPGGVQALFNIKADIATYGKVFGGGLPVGAITGKRKYMDALDGGSWQYGNDSIPEIGVTYFAGTFVRHPLALAASKASLIYLKKQGPALQERISGMTTRLAYELNTEFKKKDLPIIVNHFGSLWRIKFNDDVLYGELLFTLLRENGIHIWDGFSCFLTDAFIEEDINRLINTILKCIDEMVSAGFFNTNKSEVIASKLSDYSVQPIITPPKPDAKLGRDKEGNPAWFVVDSQNHGEYLKIDL